MTMYVRFVGNKICWTILETTAFYFGDVDEATPEELELCNRGGGELPARWSIVMLAR